MPNLIRPFQIFAAGAGAALTLVATVAFAHPEPQTAAGGGSVSLQSDAQAWARDPHMHAFYEAVVEAFAAGPDKVDVAALETRSMEIFADFATFHHTDPKKMQEHLALIPRQMVAIARNDPKVLASYDAFAVAMVGPP